MPIGKSILGRTGTTNIALPSGWPVDRNNVARYDLVWVFSRFSGSGPITGFTQFGQMLLPGDAPAPA